MTSEVNGPVQIKSDFAPERVSQMKISSRYFVVLGFAIIYSSIWTVAAHGQTGNPFLDAYNRAQQQKLQKQYLELAKKEQASREQFQRELIARAEQERSDKAEAMKRADEVNRLNDEINRKVLDIIASRARLLHCSSLSSQPEHLFVRLNGETLISKDLLVTEPVKETRFAPELAENRLKSIVGLSHKSDKH